MNAGALALEIPDELELEESGQLSIGVAGEQRALPMLAPEGKPAPVRHSSDHTTPGDLWKPATPEELEQLAAEHVGELELEELAAPCEWCGSEAAVGTCPKGIPCPRCNAGPGQRCTRPSGHPAATLHAARIDVAELEESPPLPSDEPADWEDPEYDRAQRLEEPEPTPPRDVFEEADREAEELELEEELLEETKQPRSRSSSSGRRRYRCAYCERELEPDRWVYSRRTGSRYCPPSDPRGCNTPRAYAKQERDRARARKEG